MAPAQPLQALVFGASGISGYAIVQELLKYPTASTFSRVIGLTNRPLSAKDAGLPDDGRIELYSGLDLTDAAKTRSLLQQIRDIEKTTHVYFASYVGHGSDRMHLKKVNCEILANAVEACESFCPQMQFFTLQTGGKVSMSCCARHWKQNQGADFGISSGLWHGIHPPWSSVEPTALGIFASCSGAVRKRDLLLRAV